MYERTYHAKVLRHPPRGTSAKKKKRRAFRWKRFGIFILVVGGIVGSILLVRAPYFQVATASDVHIVGTTVVDPDEVSRYVVSTFKGNALLLFPRTSIFLIAPDTVAAAVQKQFPRFKSVKVVRTDMHSLKVVVAEYPAVYLWCDGNERCSFMDASGVVFADAPYFSGNAYLKLSGGARGVYPFKPLTAADIAFVSTVSARLRAIAITPLSFSFVSDHDVSVGFMHGATVAQLLFDPSKDIDTSLEALYSGLRTDPLASLYHNASKVLEYIDVRFDSKVVYKFQ
ncbi:MAG TPA: hypothetical protein VG621_00350 [Candidatus Paceibacterota bacterium]|nr:hypothetical protein [Candidatus Paceibacterota bacterium]